MNMLAACSVFTLKRVNRMAGKRKNKSKTKKNELQQNISFFKHLHTNFNIFFHFVNEVHQFIWWLRFSPASYSSLHDEKMWDFFFLVSNGISIIITLSHWMHGITLTTEETILILNFLYLNLYQPRKWCSRWQSRHQTIFSTNTHRNWLHRINGKVAMAVTACSHIRKSLTTYNNRRCSMYHSITIS